MPNPCQAQRPLPAWRHRHTGAAAGPAAGREGFTGSVCTLCCPQALLAQLQAVALEACAWQAITASVALHRDVFCECTSCTPCVSQLRLFTGPTYTRCKGVVRQGGAGVRPSVLPHPLEELQAVGVEGGAWQGDSVVWAAREVPFVASYSAVRAGMAACMAVHLWLCNPGYVSACARGAGLCILA